MSTCDNLQDQIDTIEAELGLTPQGVYASVRTRLDILEARINNPFSPAPNVNNPFYIGNTGVSIQTGYGDPSITLVPAIPGSLFLREDGSSNNGLYAFRPDGYWSPIDTSGISFGGDISGSYISQIVIGIQGIPVNSSVPQDGYVLTYNSTLSQLIYNAPGSRTLVKNSSYTVKNSDGDIFVDSTLTPVSLLLPVIPYVGEKHGIKDFKTNANVNNITVEGNGQEI